MWMLQGHSLDPALLLLNLRRAVSLRLSTKLNIKPDTKTRFQTPSMILEQVMVGVKKGERVAPDDGRIRLKADSGGMRRKESHSRR
ncbi:hypothetical protein BLNAU_14524 [Blattamonas nauphoetae]|uniref:Transposase n=1 Tax=Blattamonas nauphoetae TaxID=2049346 RepID=A0ABQ9XK58_9EUKA|nr:hypothetical protein BLNAU_17033 [Blattamonas nauphoetae]KAK2950530.1 hypothetical protein BLNAU_14524 [Blattamonas nauphoetae]